jgi:hypothetical protein
MSAASADKSAVNHAWMHSSVYREKLTLGISHARASYPHTRTKPPPFGEQKTICRAPIARHSRGVKPLSGQHEIFVYSADSRFQ